MEKERVREARLRSVVRERNFILSGWVEVEVVDRGNGCGAHVFILYLSLQSIKLRVGTMLLARLCSSYYPG
jgi:hypothetical protein